MNLIDVRSKLPRNGSIQRRPVSAIKRIATHWDALYRPHEYDSLARYIQEANLHINRDWGGGARGDGIMYHYKIDNVGDVYWCRDHEDMLWNVGGAANWDTLAVCFDAGDDQTITKEQAESFKELMEILCFHHDEFPASQGDVYGHREFNPTECPGDQIMNLCVVPYRTNRTVAVETLSYDWPELRGLSNPPVQSTPVNDIPDQPPVVVDPAPEKQPDPVVESPENQHTSQQEIEEQQLAETPDPVFEVTPVPDTTTEEKTNTETPNEPQKEENMNIEKTNTLLTEFIDFMNGKKTWTGITMLLLGTFHLPQWLCGELSQTACATQIV
ncbi:MAG: peptidoglycan recognition family protein, partial [Bacteroidota bacterium]|nr:peptidoglycan recognition family protein [Bacteroidota bacterium]